MSDHRPTTKTAKEEKKAILFKTDIAGKPLISEEYMAALTGKHLERKVGNDRSGARPATSSTQTFETFQVSFSPVGPPKCRMKKVQCTNNYSLSLSGSKLSHSTINAWAGHKMTAAKENREHSLWISFESRSLRCDVLSQINSSSRPADEVDN